MTTLSTLPPEVLHYILDKLPASKDKAALESTCKKLRVMVGSSWGSAKTIAALLNERNLQAFIDWLKIKARGGLQPEGVCIRIFDKHDDDEDKELWRELFTQLMQWSSSLTRLALLVYYSAPVALYTFVEALIMGCTNLQSLYFDGNMIGEGKSTPSRLRDTV